MLGISCQVIKARTRFCGLSEIDCVETSSLILRDKVNMPFFKRRRALTGHLDSRVRNSLGLEAEV